jgi:hypothetical protein
LKRRRGKRNYQVHNNINTKGNQTVIDMFNNTRNKSNNNSQASSPRSSVSQQDAFFANIGKQKPLNRIEEEDEFDNINVNRNNKIKPAQNNAKKRKNYKFDEKFDQIDINKRRKNQFK